MMTRIQAVNMLTASGIAIHDCNKSESRPTDGTSIYWLPIDELLYLVETETETGTDTLVELCTASK